MSYDKYHLIVCDFNPGFWVGNVNGDLLDIMSPEYFTAERMECNICGINLSTLTIIGSKDPYETLYAIGRVSSDGEIYLDKKSFNSIYEVLNQEQINELNFEINII